ncbi:hypothetical protein GCM10010327_70530 [Streptomyces nitrosporeus]|nr:hypothetical protein GCM10010327_70530 [Streptomyces nitrosporeus]
MEQQKGQQLTRLGRGREEGPVSVREGQGAENRELHGESSRTGRLVEESNGRGGRLGRRGGAWGRTRAAHRNVGQDGPEASRTAATRREKPQTLSRAPGLGCYGRSFGCLGIER